MTEQLLFPLGRIRSNPSGREKEESLVVAPAEEVSDKALSFYVCVCAATAYLAA